MVSYMLLLTRFSTWELQYTYRALGFSVLLSQALPVLVQTYSKHHRSLGLGSLKCPDPTGPTSPRSRKKLLDQLFDRCIESLQTLRGSCTLCRQTVKPKTTVRTVRGKRKFGELAILQNISSLIYEYCFTSTSVDNFNVR